jgi:hypothetical protein
MINVNQITAQFARMSDQALQQYAQMHKDDPYTLSLALSESNRRKQTRQGAQMQAQEQPKVVDQELQNMAAPMPEDVGIAQLPSGDMNFADGGIVAFSDGGDVPRYRDQGLVRPGPGLYETDPRLAREAAERARIYRDFYRLGRSPVGAAAGAAGPAAALALVPAGMAYGLTSAMDDMRAQGYPVDPMGEFGTGAATPEQAEFDAARRQRISQGRAQQRAEESRLTAALAGQEPPAPPATGRLSAGDMALRKQPAAASGPGTGAPPTRVPPVASAAPSAAAPAAPSAAAPAAPNLDAAALMETALKQAEGAKHPYAQELGDIGQAKVKAAEEKVAGLEAIQKQFSDIYKGRKERLDTKEAELGKLKDQGTGLALLQAGAAMMSTPGSFGTALGKGVKVGTEQYAAGLDKLRAAQDRLSDARDRLEEIEAQRGELSARELFKARSEVKDVGIGAREDLIKANMQMYGLKREEAIKRVDLQIKVGLSQFEQGEQTKRSMFEQGEATKRTQITAGAQLGMLRAIANDPKLQAVYGKGQGQNKIMDEFNDFMKANPQYLTNESAALQAFLRTKGVLSSLGGAGAAGSVSNTPTGKVLQ